MATIRKKKRKYGVSFISEVCVKGRREYATFDTLSAAAKWTEETEGLLRAGLPLPGEAAENDMFFEEAVEKYSAAVAPGKKTNTRRLDQEIGKRLRHYFGDRTLQSIEPKDIAAYRDHRAKTVGPSSIIQDLSFLSCMYRTARVEWGIDVGDPAKDIKRPSAPHHRLSLLTPRQIDALLDFCCVSRRKELYSYVLLLLHTAMRPSEGAGLRWDQVHLDSSVIDLTETKTDPRRVPMTEVVKGMMVKMRNDEAGTYVFLPEEQSRQATDRPDRYFRHSFETACRYAGISDFTLYGLRHSAASYLIMNGVDIRTVAEIMGHRNISQTMKYTHFLDAHRITAIGALNKVGR